MIVLNAEKREIFGKKLAKSRKSGKLPAVLYGPKDSSTSVFVGSKDFERVWHKAGETSVVSLKLDGSDKEVLIHSVDVDPIKDTPIHVDFYAIEKGKVTTVSVPIEFNGVAPAVKELGGILVKVMHELEIEAMPKDIPQKIDVDISALKDFDSQITIKDIILPEGVVATATPEETIALASPPREEEEEIEEEPADLSEEIEVEKKGKKEDADSTVDTPSDKIEGGGE